MDPKFDGGLDILVLSSGTPQPSLVLFRTEFEIYLFFFYLSALTFISALAGLFAFRTGEVLSMSQSSII